MGSSSSKNNCNFDFVYLTLVDMSGDGRGRMIPFNQHYSKGTSVNGEPITRRKGTSGASVHLKPDLTTMHSIPWWSSEESQLGQVLCYMVNPNLRIPSKYCCRSLARKCLNELDSLGYTLKSGFEIEFTLTFTNNNPVFVANATTYMSQNIFSDFQDMFCRLSKDLKKAGVKVESMHTEYCTGQFEVVIMPSNGIKAADDCFIARQAITALCKKIGFHVKFDSFMEEGQVGNASNYNFSLLDLKTAEPVFWDASAKYRLSEVAGNCIAGVLHHAQALTALCSPTANCMKRYHGPYNPDVADWGIDSRDTCLRVRNLNKSQTYIENRLPGGKANPYLVLASTVAACITGLESKMECPAPHQKEASIIPSTLQEATNAFEQDKVLLRTLGEDFVKAYKEYSISRDGDI